MTTARKSANPAKPAKSAKPGKGAPAATKPRNQRDWPAIERDYRTDKFTLRELAAKHGLSHQSIQARAKRESWTKDLAKAIKQATSDKLAASLVASEAAKAGQDDANVVLAAAEANKDVILGHRKELKDARFLATDMMAELAQGRSLLEHREMLAQIMAGEAAEITEIASAQAAIAKALGLGNRIASMKSLAETFTKLQAAERVAFGLDDKDEDKDKDPVAQSLADFFGGIHGVASARLPFAPARKD